MTATDMENRDSDDDIRVSDKKEYVDYNIDNISDVLQLQANFYDVCCIYRYLHTFSSIFLIACPFERPGMAATSISIPGHTTP